MLAATPFLLPYTDRGLDASSPYYEIKSPSKRKTATTDEREIVAGAENEEDEVVGGDGGDGDGLNKNSKLNT